MIAEKGLGLGYRGTVGDRQMYRPVAADTEVEALHRLALQLEGQDAAGVWKCEGAGLEGHGMLLSGGWI
jgi:hypothetical protein